MKNFWGSFLGAIVGTFFTGIVSSIILIAGFAVIISSLVEEKDSAPVTVKKNSVLKITLNYAVSDREAEDPFSSFDFGTFENKKTIALHQFLSSIKQAASDEHIQGIYLELNGLPSGMATLEEIRAALVEFKKSGKFIVCYSENLTQKGYYIASVSDSIYLNPTGSMDFKGLAAELMFFKNALEKIGVQPEVIRPSGNQFKSAVEPFILEKASEPNRLQYKVMMNSIWNKLMNDMHASTKIPVDSMNTWANNFSVSFPEEALKHKVVSRLTYQDEFMNALKKKLKVTDDDDLHIIEIEKYVRVAEKSTQNQSKDKIAVIYAEGEIVDGDGSYDEIGGEDFVKSIREAREDKDVKAIVLRVNSPGGSAAASEVIWRELSLVKGKKPLIVSMGNYAASGGYYISCLADSIIADHTTITGSIGVFGVMFNVQRMLNDKLGITTDTIKTHRYADFPNLTRPFTAEEKNILQRSVDQIYTLFLKRVSEGRKINVAKLDSIAQGRVWTGADALSIGLVDKLGGLNDAISMAAKKAKLTSYQLKSFPEPEDPFDMLFGEMSQTALHLFMPDSWIQTEKYYKQAEKLSKIQGLQTRMPYTFDLY